MTTMRAIRQHEFGGPDVLRIEDVPRPDGVTRFAVGDEVLGIPRFLPEAAAYAEYVTAPSRQVVRRPAELTGGAGGRPAAGRVDRVAGTGRLHRTKQADTPTVGRSGEYASRDEVQAKRDQGDAGDAFCGFSIGAGAVPASAAHGLAFDRRVGEDPA